MNILINNEALGIIQKPFQIFSFDTFETILNRLALEHKTLPRFIYTDIEITPDISENTIVNVIDLWRLTRKSPGKNINIVEFLNKYSDIFNPREILLTWLGTQNLTLNFANNRIQALNIETIHHEEIPKLMKEFEKFKKNQIHQNNLIHFLQNNQTNTHIENFVIDKITYQRKFEFNGDLYRIFDLLKTSQLIPVIMFDNYYKIKKSFTPNLNWKSSKEEIILKYYLNYEWENIIIRIAEDNQYEVVTNVDLKNYEEIFYFVDIWKEIVSNNVSGDIVCNLSINTKVLEYILFDNNIIDIFSINDNNKIGGIFSSREIFFLHPFEPLKVTLSISNFGKLSKFHIRNIDYRQVSKLVPFILKLVFMYESNYTAIVSFFKKNGIQLEEKKIEKKKNGLLKKQLSNKNLFSKQWVRKCQFPRKIMRVVETDGNNDLETIEENGQEYSAILFPKTSFTFSDDSIEQPHYYYCIHTSSQDYFVGLKPSNTEIGFEVCCYKTNQKDKFSSSYYQYYKPELYQESQIQTSYIIEKRKKLNKNQRGLIIPFPNIVKCFDYASDDKMIFRIGVPYSPNSILYCLMLAKGIDRDVETERAKLVSGNYLLQENYDISLEELSEMLYDNTRYLDPTRFIRALEKMYKCNILLFSSNDSLILPNHDSNYIKTEYEWRDTIMILINEGAEFDNKEYPHCELLVYSHINNIRHNKNGRIIDFMKNKIFDNDISEFCKNVYDKMYIKQEFNPNLFITQSQYIENGKVYALKISYRGNVFIIHTTPLVPFNLPLLNKNELYTPVDKNLAKLFLQETSINIQKIQQNKFSYFSGDFGNNKFRIYVEFPTQNLFDTFIHKEQMSRVKTSQTMYLFSQYIHNNNITIIRKEDIESFVQRYFRIGDDISIVPKYYLQQTSNIVCESQEEVVRLVFQLNSLRKRYLDKLNNTKDYIENFYQFESDFKQNDNTLLFHKDENESLPDIFPNQQQFLHRIPISQNNIPFFFSHPFATNRHTILTIGCHNIQEAINIYVLWNSKGCIENSNTIPNIIFESLLLYNIAKNEWVQYGELNDTTPIIIKYEQKFLPFLRIE